MGALERHWAFMSWIDIPDRNDPSKTYLRRLRIVRTPWFALYLHFIFLPDTDRDCHDHPWNFGSFVIRGGYTERLYEKARSLHRNPPFLLEERRHGRFSWHRVFLHQAHKIVSVEKGLTTLVFIGREQKEWGFWTEDGWVPHTEYNREEDVPFVMSDPFA